jgi:hypothetical protein
MSAGHRVHAADLTHQTKRYGVSVGLLPRRLGVGDDRLAVSEGASRRERGAFS